MRAAQLMLDPTRNISAEARGQREREIANLVRTHRPDLAAEFRAYLKSLPL